MRTFRLGRPSPALVVSIIALIVALGGTSYAAFSVPRNSVGSRQLRKNAVTTKKIANGAVTGAKIAKSTITGKQIDLAQLGTVPAASQASSADSASSADISRDASGLAGPLASGQTLRGTFGMGGHEDAAGNFVQEEGITFQIPLATPPALNYVAPGSLATSNCPGSFANPTAAAGQLCLYGENLIGASGVAAVASTPTNFGVILFPLLPKTFTGNYEEDGVWAVTAR